MPADQQQGSGGRLTSAVATETGAHNGDYHRPATSLTTATTLGGATGTGMAAALGTPNAPVSESGAQSAATGTVGSDGSKSFGPLGSDGNPSPTVSSDGSPSTSPYHPPGSDRSINHVFLIHCCPR